jgi:hypothetical protein
MPRARRPPRLLAAAALPALFSLLAGAAEPPPAAGGPPSCPHRLWHSPDGAPLGCLEEGTPALVQERSGGWIRVRVEGWLPEAEAGRLSPPGRTAALLGTAVLAPGSPAAGAMARLLGRPDEFERDLALLRQKHAASRAELERRRADAERALERVLFSSDNLMQASENRRRLRDELQVIEREQALLRQNGLGEVMALIERHQLRAATADASGFFTIESLEPGEYRLVVGSEHAGDSPAWSLPLALVAGERRQLALSATSERHDPFAGFD